MRTRNLIVREARRMGYRRLILGTLATAIVLFTTAWALFALAWALTPQL